MKFRNRLLVIALILSLGSYGHAQEESPSIPPAVAPVGSSPAVESSELKSSEATATDRVKKAVGKLTTQTEEEALKIAKEVDQDPRAKKAAAGILQPIYVVAEALAFPAFHWLAFALMSAGVVSYGLQLALGKLVVLMRLGFSVKEIASDAVGLAISVVGLVLTTQAAAENSTFTQSPAAVISATAVGAVTGFVLYLWGQSQELEAAAGRSKFIPVKKK